MAYFNDPQDRVPQPSASPNSLTSLMNGSLGSQLGADGISIPSGGGSVSNSSPVFIGWKSGRNSDAPNTRTIGEIMQDVYGYWSRDKITSIGQRLAGAGWIQPGDVGNLDKVSQAYQRVLELTATMNAAGRNVTPEDVMRRFLGGGSGGLSRPSTYTETTRSVDLTNPKSARALLKQALQQELGRDPSAAEQQAFLGALQAAEREDPTVRSSTYKLDPETGQYRQTASTTKGGVDPSAYTDDYKDRHNQREAGAYQAAAVYFPALMEAVGAAV